MHYLNGKYITDNDPQISVTDLGLIRGFGVFDFLRTYEGKPFHLQDHLDRLLYSANTLRLELPHSPEEITAIIENLLLPNADIPHKESSVKIIVTGNVSPDQFLPSGPASLIVLTSPLKTFPKSYYSNGIQVATTSLQRSFPSAKTLYYAPAIVAMQDAKSLDVQEILYLTKNGEILEAATANFFAVKEGRIITAPGSADILIGITRNTLLRLIEKDFVVEERLLHLDELSECNETFIASSTRELMPVVKIDDQIIGQGEVGPVTKILMKRFSEYAQNLIWPPLCIDRYIPAAKIFS